MHFCFAPQIPDVAAVIVTDSNDKLFEQGPQESAQSEVSTHQLRGPTPETSVFKMTVVWSINDC